MSFVERSETGFGDRTQRRLPVGRLRSSLVAPLADVAAPLTVARNAAAQRYVAPAGGAAPGPAARAITPYQQAINGIANYAAQQAQAQEPVAVPRRRTVASARAAQVTSDNPPAVVTPQSGDFFTPAEADAAVQQLQSYPNPYPNAAPAPRPGVQTPDWIDQKYAGVRRADGPVEVYEGMDPQLLRNLIADGAAVENWLTPSQIRATLQGQGVGFNGPPVVGQGQEYTPPAAPATAPAASGSAVLPGTGDPGIVSTTGQPGNVTLNSAPSNATFDPRTGSVVPNVTMGPNATFDPQTGQVVPNVTLGPQQFPPSTFTPNPTQEASESGQNLGVGEIRPISSIAQTVTPMDRPGAFGLSDDDRVVLTAIKDIESNYDYAEPPGAEPYAAGAYQFIPSTWNAMMDALGPEYQVWRNGRADLAPVEVQDAAAAAYLRDIRNVTGGSNDPYATVVGWYGGGQAAAAYTEHGRAAVDGIPGGTYDGVTYPNMGGHLDRFTEALSRIGQGTG